LSTYVVDASVAAKWFAPDEDHADAAFALLEHNPRLHAPDFFLLELDNLFCKWARRGIVTPDETEEMRRELRKQTIVYYPFAEIQDHAFALANETGRALYDCLYLALAILIDGVMVTADKKFHDDLANTPLAGRVAWVGEIK
jgi:predicted nucleic acid-binding protein